MAMKLVAQLGDASPIDYGGYFIYEDDTGVYAPEGELLESPDTDETPEGWKVYRFSLDRLKQITQGENVYLVSFKYVETWPYPPSAYDEWFNRVLNRGAAYV